jgi:hypothetical protein
MEHTPDAVAGSIEATPFAVGVHLSETGPSARESQNAGLASAKMQPGAAPGERP